MWPHYGVWPPYRVAFHRRRDWVKFDAGAVRDDGGGLVEADDGWKVELTSDYRGVAAGNALTNNRLDVTSTIFS
jgi:hypothetical protein